MGEVYFRFAIKIIWLECTDHPSKKGKLWFIRKCQISVLSPTIVLLHINVGEIFDNLLKTKFLNSIITILQLTISPNYCGWSRSFENGKSSGTCFSTSTSLPSLFSSLGISNKF